jgi:hypothetical protein
LVFSNDQRPAWLNWLFLAIFLFISEHPQWDQYRLVQAAIAGFLFQQGCKERSVVRNYLGGLFRRNDCRASQPLV